MPKENTKNNSLPSDQWFYLSESNNSFQLATVNQLSRAFQYGDGIFESIRIQANKAPFFESHWNRFKNSASHFKYKATESTWKSWNKTILSLVEKNIGIFRLKIMLTRQSEGLYTPTEEELILLIRLSPISLVSNINTPVSIAVQNGVSTFNPKISNHKSCNSLTYVMAGIEAKERNLDSIVLRNTKDEVIECHAYNIFFRKGNIIYTPWLESGCLNGVTRNWVIEYLEKSTKYNIEARKIRLEETFGMDEIIITNAILGIIGVAHFEKIKLKEHSISKELQYNWSSKFN